jgi:hypothetical protein
MTRSLLSRMPGEGFVRGHHRPPQNDLPPAEPHERRRKHQRPHRRRAWRSGRNVLGGGPGECRGRVLSEDTTDLRRTICRPLNLTSGAESTNARTGRGRWWSGRNVLGGGPCRGRVLSEDTTDLRRTICRPLNLTSGAESTNARTGGGRGGQVGTFWEGALEQRTAGMPAATRHAWAPPDVRPMLARRVVDYTPRCASGVRPDLPHASASRDGIPTVRCSRECRGRVFSKNPQSINRAGSSRGRGSGTRCRTRTGGRSSAPSCRGPRRCR